ncbi:MAG: SxtJ family membrane protein [Gammaproteobacteria bacterium]|nr:SxtJ family membrane protein [Gammaproteobacteria bacterium]
MTIDKATMTAHQIDVGDPQELRKFSRVMAVHIPLAFGLLIPWIWNLNFPVWPWLVAVVFGLTGQFAPGLLQWPYKAWFKLAEILGWFNSRVILSIVYFLLFTPIALLLKLFGNSPLDKKGVLIENSYRIVTTARDDNHFERPF